MSVFGLSQKFVLTGRQVLLGGLLYFIRPADLVEKLLDLQIQYILGGVYIKRVLFYRRTDLLLLGWDCSVVFTLQEVGQMVK